MGRVEIYEFRFQGLEFRFRIQGSGCRVQGVGGLGVRVRVYVLGSRLQSLGFRV